MFLSQGIEMVLSPIKKDHSVLPPVLVLRIKGSGEMSKEEPHHLHIRVCLDEAMVGPAKGVDGRDQGNSWLDLEFRSRVGGSLLLPLSTTEIGLTDPGFIDVDHPHFLLEQRDHHLGVFESEAQVLLPVGGIHHPFDFFVLHAQVLLEHLPDKALGDIQLVIRLHPLFDLLGFFDQDPFFKLL